MWNAQQVAHAIGFCEHEDPELPRGVITALAAENDTCPSCNGLTPCECDATTLDDELAGSFDGVQAIGAWWSSDQETPSPAAR